MPASVAIPIVGGSGARVPTQFLDEKGDFAGQKSTQPRGNNISHNGGSNGHLNGNGGISNGNGVLKHDKGVSANVTIDLTDDDNDDVTLVEARGPNVLQNQSEQVCIGMVNAVVLTMLGLPASFHFTDAAGAKTSNTHPKWSTGDWPSGKDFYLEPGFRPVELVPRGEGSTNAMMGEKAEIHVHEVVAPMDVKAQLEGSGRPIPNSPQIKSSSFGTLADKYRRGLHALLIRRMIRLSARCRIVTPNSGRNFLHAIEVLCFTTRRDAEKVSNYLFCENIQLEYPARYNPAHFAGHPPIEMTNRNVPSHASPFSRFTLDSRGTVMQNKESTEEEKKRQVDAVYASLRGGEDLEMVEADARIATPLLPHQKQALAFLLDREKYRSFEKASKTDIISLWKPVKRADKVISYQHVVTQGEQKRAPYICRGAILADDMGLGKTLAGISLIASTSKEALRFEEVGEEKEEQDDKKNGTAKKMNKSDEEDVDDDDDDDDVTIEDFNINLHGAPPAKKPRASTRPKKKGKREQKKEDAELSRRGDIVTRTRATLIVLPLTLVSAWEGQLDEHWSADERPSVYIYHGSGRLTNAREIADHDIVMTTYATLATEYAHSIAEEEGSDAEEEEEEDDAGRGGRSKAKHDSDDVVLVDARGNTVGGKTAAVQKTAAGSSKEDARKSASRKKKRKAGGGGEEAISPIQQIEWFRIMLDEAHTIKEARTLQSRAVCNLSANRRVCLTGTPVQNRIDDLFALIRFLRLEPFDDRGVWNQFCGSKEKSASLRSTRKGANEKNAEPLDKMALARVQTIMKFLTLRRTKEMQMANGERLLSLPPKYARVLTLKFDDKEKGTYDEMRLRYKDDFETMKASDTLKHNYATILHEISNLRMTCDHMGLVDASKDAKRKKEQGDDDDDPATAIIKDGMSRDRAIRLFELLCSSDRARCCICNYDLASFAEEGNMEGAKSPVLTRCIHLFCSDCLRTRIGSMQYDKPKADDRFGCPDCGVSVSPLLEMRELLPADVQQQDADRVLSVETFGCDKGVDIDRRPDYSSKIKALMVELEAFSRCNPSSLLYDSDAPVLDQVAASGEGEEEEKSKEPVMLVTASSGISAGPIKSVIFSQWTKMLDRIAKATHRSGIKAAYLDGRMRRQERSDNLDKFKNDAGVEVLLVSLKAGGIGLNLVSACRAYLMEPYWNPAIENQGLDRVHRMGQVRPVVTTKFIMSNSIEENMLELQKRKLRLAESVGEKRTSETQREELNLLFSAREEEGED
ncbi:hypothetical protein CBS101457_000289 [Exobasidium rhododendri]|nr:hypothetical protein CBS101457_000289 [Exobasidium rhododendri]